MIKECLHILPVDDMSKVEERINVIKVSLSQINHRVYKLKGSIAVVVEEAREIVEEENKNEVEKCNDVMSYEEFVYGMRKLIRKC